jgi:hypothetical protein
MRNVTPKEQEMALPKLITNEKERIYWEYFLSLESDIARLSRYIALEKSNKKTHSIEMARLLLASSSECDTLLKEVCKKLDSNFIKKNSDINKYRTILNKHITNLSTSTVRLRGHSWKLQPWKDIKTKSPTWWTSTNSVKHQRADNFFLANLENTISSIAALLVLNIIYYRLSDVDWIMPTPQLFLAPALISYDVSTWGSIAAMDELSITPRMRNKSNHLRSINDFI